MHSALYNPLQPMHHKQRLWVAIMALVCLVAAGLAPRAFAANWEQPAAELARQIAALAGPGPARLVLRNNSALSAAEIPSVRRQLERNLRSYGILAGPSDSATEIRVTLSQNQQGGLWVAEILEGTESRVTMLPVALPAAATLSGGPNLTLRRTLLFAQPGQILDAAVLNIDGGPLLLVLSPDRIAAYTRNANTLAAIGAASTPDWRESRSFPIPHTRPYPRDPRGRIVPAQDHLFDAWLPGVLCTGTALGGQLSVSCSDSDDPWPVSSTQRAFYNASRDNFTGLLAPGYGIDLAPFYQAAEIPRPTGPALLLAEIDGRVLLLDNSTLKPVSGTADWGSDLALIRSSCGSGAQLLVDGSGAAAAGDTLRAWEIPGREAIPVSPPLPIDGAITALNATPGTTEAAITQAVMIVRHDPADLSDTNGTRYEVWNVAALCN